MVVMTTRRLFTRWGWLAALALAGCDTLVKRESGPSPLPANPATCVILTAELHNYSYRVAGTSSCAVPEFTVVIKLYGVEGARISVEQIFVAQMNKDESFVHEYPLKEFSGIAKGIKAEVKQ